MRVRVRRRIAREVSERARTRAPGMSESERWFRMSARRRRDRFNLTNTTSVFEKADVNMSSLTSIFGKIDVNKLMLTSVFLKTDVNELTLFTNMQPCFC